jgi:tetratricopeptide (TPR) repeat protein
MGQALTLLGRQDEAVDAFVMAVDLAPTNTLLREEATLAALNAGRANLAMDIIQPMLTGEEWKASRRLVMEMGERLLSQRRPRLALALLKPALNHDDNDAGLWLLAARVHYELDESGHAGDCIRQAVRADETLTEARLMLAYHHLVTGQKKSAAQLASAILKDQPNDPEAKLILIRAGG